MGELNLHDLNKYISKYKCNIFVETGTGKGFGLQYAMKYKFDRLYSIEIMKELYDFNVKKFNNTPSNIFLLNDNSLNGIDYIFNNVTDNDVILFWLDAHFPGADFQINSYLDNFDKKIRTPLEDELSLIFKKKPNNKYVFIIDDLRIYEDGNYELGNIDRDRYGVQNMSLEPIINIISDTHNIEKDLRHQGFLILTPK